MCSYTVSFYRLVMKSELPLESGIYPNRQNISPQPLNHAFSRSVPFSIGEGLTNQASPSLFETSALLAN